MKNLYIFICGVILNLCVIYDEVTAFSPGGGVGGWGAPGGRGAPGGPGAPGGVGAPGGYRPISPGGTDSSPDGGVIGEQEEKDNTSPQQRPDLPGFETGVQENTFGRSRGCDTGGSVELEPITGNSGEIGNSNIMCLELLCAFKCKHGYVKKNGCPTCTCLQIGSKLLAKCPKPPIAAIWSIHPSKSIGIVIGGGLYTMRENEEIEVSSYKLSKHLQDGGLCGSTIDAAFTARLDLVVGRKDFTVYFSGKYYSIYKDSFSHVTGPHHIHRKYESGSKTPLQLTFPSYVKKIDAAMKWHKNGKIYFFFKYLDTGYYTKYDPKTNTMYREYPRRTVDWWIGLPKEGPDAAYTSVRTGKTYFAVGNQIYVFDEGSTHVQSGYPKPIKKNFVRCEDV